MKAVFRRTASYLLSMAVAHTPAGSKEWARAMQTELDYVEGNWSAFFWALGGLAALLKLSMIRLLLTTKRRENNMKYIGQILLGANVTIAISILGSLIWLTGLKIAGLQMGSLPMWPRLVFIAILEIAYIAIATELWRRRKLVSIGISLAGLAQLLSVILTAIRIVHKS